MGKAWHKILLTKTIQGNLLNFLSSNIAAIVLLSGLISLILND